MRLSRGLCRLIIITVLMFVGILQRYYVLRVTSSDPSSLFSRVSRGASVLCPDYRQKLDRDATICWTTAIVASLAWIFSSTWLLCHPVEDASDSQKRVTFWVTLGLTACGANWFHNFLGCVLVVRLFTIHSQQSILDFADDVKRTFTEEGLLLSIVHVYHGCTTRFAADRGKMLCCHNCVAGGHS